MRGRHTTTLCFGEYDPSSAECAHCEVKEQCIVESWFEEEEFEGEECE